MEGDFRKRIHRLEGDLGIIELLANGQQFVACGTHSSGARIEWDNVLPDDPPAVTTDQLETLWQQLADVLPVSVPDLLTPLSGIISSSESESSPSPHK
ncbi:hypothetical protein OA41_02080 [Klebsiella aerogenes]|nr:hypothetical protein SS20_16005 [Klebsiella aerogenes]KKY72563.1 hypothetical protein OA41_02080 [Klebsiella aerogenes]